MKTLKLKQKNIITLKPENKKFVYDIEVNNAHHYILKNGIISHNSISFIPQNIQSSGCLIPEEYIITKDGIKQMKDIKDTDYVLSHDNEYHKVEKVWNLKKQTYTFTFENNEEITCSNTHKFLINIKNPELESSWKTAEELTENDEIYILEK